MVYGPGVAGNLATLLRIADTPWPLPFASFHNRRSLVSLENLIAAVAFALTSETAKKEIYLVADPEAVTFADIVSVAAPRLGAPGAAFPRSARTVLKRR